MNKPPSAETRLRTAKRAIAKLARDYAGLRRSYEISSGQLQKAGQEIIELKARVHRAESQVDILLRRDEAKK